MYPMTKEPCYRCVKGAREKNWQNKKRFPHFALVIDGVGRKGKSHLS